MVKKRDRDREILFINFPLLCVCVCSKPPHAPKLTKIDYFTLCSPIQLKKVFGIKENVTLTSSFSTPLNFADLCTEFNPTVSSTDMRTENHSAMLAVVAINLRLLFGQMSGGHNTNNTVLIRFADAAPSLKLPPLANLNGNSGMVIILFFQR